MLTAIWSPPENHMYNTLGRAWKLIVLFIATLGGIGFFVPLRAYPIGGVEIGVSAYRMLFGYDHAAQIDPGLAAAPDREAVVARWNDAISHETETRFDQRVPVRSRAPLYFVAAIACAVIASIALVRGQLGFLSGLLVVASGLWALWGWSRELLIDRHTEVSTGGIASPHVAWGASLLLGCGVLALGAGIGSLIIADPGRKRRTVRVVVDGEARDVEVGTPTMTVPAAQVRKERVFERRFRTGGRRLR